MDAATKIAVIGLGHWGKNLVRNVHALGALGAMHDVSASARRAFGTHYPEVPVAERPEQIW
ncbi:MAG: hypothetical protein ACREIP_04025, partial [Alphaproteobacteria bacterium]